MTLSYECPLPECDWAHEIDHDLDARNTLAAPGVAAVMGVPLDAFLSLRAHQAARNLEHTLEQHLNSHTLIEWVTALAAAQRRVARLEALVAPSERGIAS